MLSAGPHLYPTFILPCLTSMQSFMPQSVAVLKLATRSARWVNAGRVHGECILFGLFKHKEGRKTRLGVSGVDWLTNKNNTVPYDQLKIIPQFNLLIKNSPSELRAWQWLWKEAGTECCWLVWCPTDTPPCQRVTDCTQNAVGFLPRYTVHTYPHTYLSMHSEVDAHALFCTCMTHARSAQLQVLSWLVLRLRGGEVILQEALQVLKGGPLLGLFSPAGQHELVQGFGALCWARHSVATLHLV